ncbi:Zn-ribbon domain-containing OB-fold protein [Cupriavidus basilensis]
MWQAAKGSGTLYSYSTVMRGPTPAFASIAPYTVGFVEMDEGYHLFAQIEGAPETLRIGARMTARLIERGGQRLPVFAAA